MATCEKDLLDRLTKLFPDRIIYADLYLKRTGALSFEIYKQAKASQQSRPQWLSSKGFTWKETGYVEPDMRFHEEKPLVDTDAYAIADYVFRTYPLAGEYILTEEETLLLYQSASQVVKKILKSDTRISKAEEAVLVLETIELLKGWSTELLNEETVGTFWKYIFLQYGFNPENSKAAEDRLYARFRAAIENTLVFYKRFFASGKTQRYYTSLLLHALAPKQSIEAFFNILFDFYVKNLDFQYVVEDIGYKVFTKGMRARWDSRVSKNEELQLRSDTVFSGLQALFRERPGYMAVLCDTLVKKMDALLRGEETGLLDTDRNYWDRLLWGWYQKKSSVERVHAQGERRQRKAEFVATSTERIYMQYAMVNEEVGLSLPRIRLPKVGDRHPVIHIFQKDICIFEDELSVTGNDLCLTTRSCFVPLQKTAYDFSAAPQIRAEIEYLDEIIYESGNKLLREYILFDDDGNDRVPKNGFAHLFTGSEKEIDFACEDGVYRLPHPGQLYRIHTDEVSSVAIDGTEVFADASTVSQFRHHTSLRKVGGLRAWNQGKSVDIFSSPFSFYLCPPEGEQLIRYHISIDGVRYSLDQWQRDGNEILISSADDDGLTHTIKVIDVGTDFVKYEYGYTVLTDCRMEFHQHLYRAGIDEVTVLLSRRGKDFEITLPLAENTDSISFSAAGIDLQFEAEPPVIHCSFMGKSAFEAPKAVWHSSIDSGEIVRLRLPNGWEGRLMLDGKSVPATSDRAGFELGNELRSMSLSQPEAVLWLDLKNEHGYSEKHEITTIVFAPKFLCPPLEVSEDRLLWQVENNYVGELASQFQVICNLPDGRSLSYDTSMSDNILEEAIDFTDGRYPYQIFLKKKSIFSSGASDLIFQGELLVGNPNTFAFKEKEIIIADALCWDFESDALKSVCMRPGCGIIQDLEYLDTSIASGEAVAAPHYLGTLYFEDRLGRRLPFNAKPSNEYELVNPVNVWIINEHLLILRCVTEDAVYIDSRYSTIVNRSPSVTMSRTEQEMRLMTPDYFEYKAKEV